MEDKKTILEKVQDFFAANEIDAKVEENEPKKETFETVLLVDGVTEVTIEPNLEVGSAIVLSSEDGTPVAAPVGEYELQDGRVIVVAEEGVVAEIKDASMEEEELATDEPNQPDKVKRLIESIVTEKQFVTAEAFNKVSTELETEKKTVKFLQENHEELTTLFNELKQFTKETFETLLAEPSKEPVQKKKNPLDALKKGESVNIFTKLKS